MDSILAIDSALVVDAIRAKALETLSAYRNGATVSWIDAELAIYLIFIFGEINKSKVSCFPHPKACTNLGLAGAKGRGAFCQAPTIPKEERKKINYAEFPLTLHGELVFALIESGIATYPHQMVVMQAFESIVRYTDFFKVRKGCIVPVLEAMIGTRYVIWVIHNEKLTTSFQEVCTVPTRRSAAACFICSISS
jgi:exportin-T